ncbi:paralemmin-3 [Elgaria multicarinata webbii]|uniref:paralemmin-3 n=1 Tax=Elgaria multicarinata webbii TaxID=159646 RepID=UPI002FCD471B
MAERSLFAQRLQAITERRRLQERILATRRELEEERLRAQRLKRKSLRDRWLMEGMSAPTDDNGHMSSVWEAQARIQGLEQDLSSLQSQMQQLDNPELHQGRLQPDESVKALKEVKHPSLDGLGEVDGTSSSPGGVFGRESSPEKASVEVSPVAVEAGLEVQPPPAVKPACQSSEPGEAPGSHQRKLAVEEMVIRDHLGQEVGSMDAVGQKQRSLGKEEDPEGHTELGNGCEACPKEAPAATESQLGSELGSRDGPEGESPTSQDQQSPSQPPQEGTSSLDSPTRTADGEAEVSPLAQGVALTGGEQEKLPKLGAKSPEPAQELPVGNAPAAGPVAQGQGNHAGKPGLQELQGSGQGGERSWQEQPQPSRPDQIPPAQETQTPNSLEEAKLPLLGPVKSSSLSEQIPLTLQDQLPTVQDATGSLPDQIPSSFQPLEGSLPEPVLPLFASPPPSTFLNQTPPLQESKEPLLVQVPASLQEPLVEPNPPSLQDHLSSSLEQKPSSLQGEATFPQEAKCSLMDRIPSPLSEANGRLLDQIPTVLQDESASLPDQILSPLPDQFTALAGRHETERSLLIPTALQGQELEAKESLPDLTLSLTNQPSSLPDQITALQEAEGLSLREIPVALQDQITASSKAQNPSLLEADDFLLGQVLSSEDEDKQSVPGEAPTSGPGQLLFYPPSQEGTDPASLQEARGSLPDQVMASPIGQTVAHLPGAEESSQDQAQTTIVAQITTSLKGQEAEEALPEKLDPPSLLEETPTLPDQVLSLNKAPNLTLQDATTVPDILPFSSQDPVQPLLDKVATVENKELKADGGGETTEVLGNLHAEQQPLLNEAKPSVACPDVSTGDQQHPNAGVVKPPAAPSQEAPTYTVTSANTASLCQLQAAAPRQGEGQEQGQSRRKQKSCQCCSVM